MIRLFYTIIHREDSSLSTPSCILWFSTVQEHLNLYKHKHITLFVKLFMLFLVDNKDSHLPLESIAFV